jgi:hypothetical protein
MCGWLNLNTIKFSLIKLATDFYWQPSYFLGEKNLIVLRYKVAQICILAEFYLDQISLCKMLQPQVLKEYNKSMKIYEKVKIKWSRRKKHQQGSDHRHIEIQTKHTP